MKFLSAALLSLITASLTFAQANPTDRVSNQPVPPFRIAGNLYYVGPSEVTSFLITTPKGHFLLDGGFAETAAQIEHNIAQLGFDAHDVKYLLSSHAHYDHAGGLAELKRLTGAAMVASRQETPRLENGGRDDFRFGDTLLFPAVQVDRAISDGESITLGNQKMTAFVTPGHTKGNTTWTAEIVDGTTIYKVVFAGSPTTLDYSLTGRESYPGIAEDFEKSFAVFKRLPCDIFLSCHGSFFGFAEKRERLLRGEKPNPFVDPKGYHRFIDQYEKEFRDKLAQQKSSAGANQ